MVADFAAVLLAYPVAVEGCVTTTEFVLGFLTVVGFQVGQDSRNHVGVLLSAANRGEHVGASLFLEPSGQAPNGEDDHEEVSNPKGQALLAALHPQGVQVHVELRGEVAVDDGVDVSEVNTACVLVDRVGL